MSCPKCEELAAELEQARCWSKAWKLKARKGRWHHLWKLDNSWYMRYCHATDELFEAHMTMRHLLQIIDSMEEDFSSDTYVIKAQALLELRYGQFSRNYRFGLLSRDQEPAS